VRRRRAGNAQRERLAQAGLHLQRVSDLGALTASSAWIYNQIAANLNGLLIVAFALGLWRALGSGWLFDRTRGRVLVGLPLLVAAVPVLAFAGSPLIAIAGALLWGAAGGVLDSSIKALVAALVPTARLATAYGVFAAVQGAAAIGGGLMAGALYERSLPLLIAAVAATQVVALVLLIATLRREHSQSFE
jgi:MFS family permease